MSTWTLAIDTSTIVTAALAHDGELVAEDSLDDTRAHTEQLMPMVVGLCDKAGIALAQVNEVVVGVGPGPFTGLRVGIVTAHTIAALAGVTARGICSLDAIALQAVESSAEVPAEFLAVIDARRKELYWARYSATGERLEGPAVNAPEDLPALPVTGPGASLVADEGRPQFGPHQLCAGILALRGQSLPDMGLDALYLRAPDAAVPTSRKSTLLPEQRLAPRRDRRPRP